MPYIPFFLTQGKKVVLTIKIIYLFILKLFNESIEEFFWNIQLMFLLLIWFYPDRMIRNTFEVWKNDLFYCSTYAKWDYLEMFLLLKWCSCAVW